MLENDERTNGLDQNNCEPIENETVQEETAAQSQQGPVPYPVYQETPAQKKKHRRKMNAYVKALCCAIIFGVVAGALIMGSTVISRKVIAKQIPIESTAARLSTAADGGSGGSAQTGETYTVSQITKQCKSSVVAITNKSISEIQTMFGVMEQESEGSGSGVIVGKNDTELLIVTNNHVVENSNTLTVCFNDSEDAVFNAQIKGTDPNNDLAVVAIKLSDISDEVLKSISVATIGDSSKLEVGDEVVAIGNALGFGQSVTQGIVSALNREVTIEDTKATLLQTDAAINPGNSGGALFNMKGELIGINSAKYASAQIEGMGFAIPMSTAQPIIENLMSRETREKIEKNYGFLNISGQDVSEDENKRFGVPRGVYVSNVTADGAAEKAGIKAGDIITSLDGKNITGIDQLREELTYYKAGEKVDVVIQRNTDGSYKEQTVTVTLDNATKELAAQQKKQSSSNGQDSQGDGSQTIPFFGGDGDFFGFD